MVGFVDTVVFVKRVLVILLLITYAHGQGDVEIFPPEIPPLATTRPALAPAAPVYTGGPGAGPPAAVEQSPPPVAVVIAPPPPVYSGPTQAPPHPSTPPSPSPQPPAPAPSETPAATPPSEAPESGGAQATAPTEAAEPVLDGVAYDAYLEACAVFLDLNSNGQLDVVPQQEPFGITSPRGRFQIPVGGVSEAERVRSRLVLQPASAEGSRSIEGNKNICHDSRTGLKMVYPLRALPGKTVLSVFSTLASIMADPLTGLLTPLEAQDRILRALNLPPVEIGAFDAYGAFLANPSDPQGVGRQVYIEEQKLHHLVYTTAFFLAMEPVGIPSIAMDTLTAIASTLQRQGRPGRRLSRALRQQEALDFTDAEVLAAIILEAETAAIRANPRAVHNVSTDEVVSVANGVAIVNSAIAQSSDLDGVLNTTKVGQEVVANSAASLSAGNITTTEFAMTISQSTLQATVEETVVNPQELPSNDQQQQQQQEDRESEDDGDGLAAGSIAAIVVGVAVVVVAVGGVALLVRFRAANRRKQQEYTQVYLGAGSM